MIARTSKEVTDRQKSCQFLLTALATQGPQIADLLTERVRPFLLEGDAVPEEQVLHIALSRVLEGKIAAAIRADEAMYKANADLIDLREERRAATKRLIQQVIRLRTILVGRYQAPRLKQLGLTTKTSHTPVRLLRQADRITEAFGSEDLQAWLGLPFIAGEGPPLETTAELGALAEALRTLLRRIDEMVRRRDAAQIEKHEHLADHDLVYVYTARTFEAFCRLSRKADLAEKVRRTLPRPPRQGPDAVNSDAETSDKPPTSEVVEAKDEVVEAKDEVVEAKESATAVSE